MAYNENIIANSPVYVSSVVNGNKISVKFNTFGSSLKTPYATLTEFEIADSNGTYVSATASIISADTIEVWSDSIANPSTVRYCWKSCPVQASLFNNEDLPASPFITSN